MSKSYGKVEAKEIIKMEDKYGNKSRASESMDVNLEKCESKTGTHVIPSVGASVTGKKFVTKMES